MIELIDEFHYQNYVTNDQITLNALNP